MAFLARILSVLARMQELPGSASVALALQAWWCMPTDWRLVALHVPGASGQSLATPLFVLASNVFIRTMDLMAIVAARLVSPAPYSMPTANYLDVRLVPLAQSQLVGLANPVYQLHVASPASPEFPEHAHVPSDFLARCSTSMVVLLDVALARTANGLHSRRMVWCAPQSPAVGPTLAMPVSVPVPPGITALLIFLPVRYSAAQPAVLVRGLCLATVLIALAYLAMATCIREALAHVDVPRDQLARCHTSTILSPGANLARTEAGRSRATVSRVLVFHALCLG